MRGRTVLLVVLLLALVAVLGWRATQEESRPLSVLPAISAADGVSEGLAPERADVVILGDSVTDQSSARIVEAMADRRVSVIGLSGYRTDQLLPTIEDALGGAVRPPVAVVMSGYNDIWQGAEDEMPIDEVMELLDGIECAVWVLIPTKGPWDRDRAEDFDERVQEAAEEVGVAVETAWRDAVDAERGPDPDPDLITMDGVHPTEAGTRKVAEVMDGAVDRICG